MKKPNTSTRTPCELRKLATQLKAQADLDEAPLIKAERTRKIAELNKKYAGTAWLSKDYRSAYRVWATKIIRFFPAKPINGRSGDISYEYQALCITNRSKENEAEFTPGHQADWYGEKSANIDPDFELAAAKFDKYAEAITLLSATAARDLARARTKKPRR